MIDQRQADPVFSGVIVNISSVSATEASINRGDYCISKAGVAMATQLWAAPTGRVRHRGLRSPPRPDPHRHDGRRHREVRQLIAGGLTGGKPLGRARDVGRAVAMLARGELTLRHRQRAGHRRRPDAAAALRVSKQS